MESQLIRKQVRLGHLQQGLRVQDLVDPGGHLDQLGPSGELERVQRLLRAAQRRRHRAHDRDVGIAVQGRLQQTGQLAEGEIG